MYPPHIPFIAIFPCLDRANIPTVIDGLDFSEYCLELHDIFRYDVNVYIHYTTLTITSEFLFTSQAQLNKKVNTCFIRSNVHRR